MEPLAWLWALLTGSSPRPPPEPWLPYLGWREFSANALITGRTGSGKTTLLKAILARAAVTGGGCIFCPKPLDSVWVLDALRRAGRTKVAVFRPGLPSSINVLGAVARPELGAESQAVIDAGVLEDAFRAAANLGDGRGEDSHWWSGGMASVREACLLCRLAGFTPTADRVRRIIVSSAASPKRLATPAWKQGENAILLREAHSRHRGTAAFARSEAYWCRERVQTAPRQWSGYAGQVLTPLGMLCAGELDGMLGAADPTVDLPAWVEGGGWLVLDLPLAEFGQLALVAVRAILSAVQAVCLRRRVGPRSKRFVFLLDEYPLYVSPRDADFLALSRASLAPSCMVAQGIESFQKAIPGERGEAVVNTLVGNTSVQIHCSPTDTQALWICERLGSRVRSLFSGSTPQNAYADPLSLFDQGGQGHASWNQSVVRVLEPGDIRLRTGSAHEGGYVDALVTGPAHCRPYRVITYRRRA